MKTEQDSALTEMHATMCTMALMYMPNDSPPHAKDDPTLIPPQLIPRLTQLAADDGYAVRYVDGNLDTGGIVPEEAAHAVLGVTTPRDHLIELRADMSPASTARTLVHELVHADYNYVAAQDSRLAQARTVMRLSLGLRALEELHAQSVSGLVCSTLNVADIAFTAQFLATWSDGDGVMMEAVRSTAAFHADMMLQLILNDGELVQQLAALKKGKLT